MRGYTVRAAKSVTAHFITQVTITLLLLLLYYYRVVNKDKHKYRRMPHHVLILSVCLSRAST